MSSPRRSDAPPSLEEANQAQIKDLVKRNRTLEYTNAKLNEKLVAETNRSKEAIHDFQKRWHQQEQLLREECEDFLAYYRFVQLSTVSALEAERINVLSEQKALREEKLLRLQRDFRILMFHTKEREIEERMVELEEDNEKMVLEQQELASVLRKKLGGLFAQLRLKDGEIASMNSERDTADKDVGKLREENARLQTSLSSTSSKLERVTLQLEGAQSSRSELESVNEDLKRKNYDLQRQIDKWQRLEHKGDVELDTLRTRSNELAVEAQELQDQLAREKDAHKKILDREQKRIERLKTTAQEWKEMAEVHQSELEEAKKELADLQKELKELKSRPPRASAEPVPAKAGKAAPRPRKSPASESEGEQDFPKRKAAPRRRKGAASEISRKKKAMSPVIEEEEKVEGGAEVEIIESPPAKAKEKEATVSKPKPRPKPRTKTLEVPKDVESAPPPAIKPQRKRKASADVSDVESEKPEKKVARTVTKPERSRTTESATRKPSSRAASEEPSNTLVDPLQKSKKRKVNVFALPGSQSSQLGFDFNLGDNNLNIPTVLTPVKEDEGPVPNRTLSNVTGPLGFTGPSNPDLPAESRMSLKNPSSGRPSTATPIPQLPDGVWAHICRYLTHEQVRGMYGLNRPLLRIAMALRYQKVFVGRLQGPGSEGTRRCLSIADNLELRGRVQSLSFTSTRIGESDFTATENAATEAVIKKFGDQIAVVKVVLSRWRSKIQPPESPIAPQFQSRPNTPSNRNSVTLSRSFSLSRRKTREQTVRDEIIDELSSFLGRLPKLQELTVHHPNPGEETDSAEDEWSLSLLPHSETEAPYSTSLRSLTLSGSLIAWKRIIPHYYEWPHLENFSVKVDDGYQNAQDNTYALRLELAPFIRRHSKTLKSVSFRSAMELDLTSLYDGMGWLPRLESVEIEQPYLLPSLNHSDSLNQFLHRHHDTLKSFKWSFVDPSRATVQPFKLNPHDWFEQSPYHLTLPCLRQLHLSFPGLSNSALFEGALFYCTRHSTTITQLRLSGISLNLTQFHEFLLYVGSKNLQELDISLEILTSYVFSNLCLKFPALKTLRLAYSSVGRQKSISEPTLVDPTGGGILKIPNVPVVRTWQFRQDMTTLVLSGWPLLELYFKKNGDKSWREYKPDQVGKLVVKSLPRIGFVNEVYRETFLQL
ncbi:hypothetical protein NP233_g8955 [Leucocoprinus birnbaumii]|uniref:Uncharacterized protein n=1 Tax=Leucocoprinus birnbaumii TaxID=56174 RepID=A0AAD5VLG2_9AGAR|nr:hypothetical protein NP233_g8955 [Leucocoprinus birnbaumii]